MRDVVLSPTFGVPVACLALVLLLAREVVAVAGGRSRGQRLLTAAAIASSVMVLALVVARFLEYA